MSRIFGLLVAFTLVVFAFLGGRLVGWRDPCRGRPTVITRTATSDDMTIVCGNGAHIPVPDRVAGVVRSSGEAKHDALGEVIVPEPSPLPTGGD
jgi:hypothetical protein